MHTGISNVHAVNTNSQSSQRHAHKNILTYNKSCINCQNLSSSANNSTYCYRFLDKRGLSVCPFIICAPCLNCLKNLDICEVQRGHYGKERFGVEPLAETCNCLLMTLQVAAPISIPPLPSHFGTC